MTGSKPRPSSSVNAYNVVVLDRDLPGIHGDTLCQMITERDDRVMVLMLTAASAPGERVSGLGLGADDYLAKPFHFPELVARIRSLARRQPSARGRILRAAGIELDPLRRTVTRDGRQLHLSVKEFAVLEALLLASAGLPQRGGPARTGLGRAGRPVHQHRHGDHRPAAAQARRPAGHHDHAGCRLPYRRSAHEHGYARAAGAAQGNEQERAIVPRSGAGAGVSGRCPRRPGRPVPALAGRARRAGRRPARQR